MNLSIRPLGDSGSDKSISGSEKLGEKGGVVSELSSEVLQKIGSIFEQKQSPLAGKELEVSNVIKYAKHERDTRLNTLLNFIVNILDEVKYSEVSDFKYLMKESGFLKFSSLLQIKENLDGTKNLLITLLKSIDQKELDKIDRFCQSNKMLPAFQNLAVLTKIHKKVDATKTLRDDAKRSATLHEIAQRLTRMGESEMAVEVAKKIPDDFEQAEALREIVLTLEDKGDKARALAIKEQHWLPAMNKAKLDQSERLSQLFDYLLEVLKGDDQSEEIKQLREALLVEKRVVGGDSFREVRDNLDTLKIRLAQQLKVLGLSQRERISRYCHEQNTPLGFRKLMTAVSFYEQLESAKKVTDEKMKEKALLECIDLGTEADLLDEALQIAAHITNVSQRSFSFAVLAMLFSRKGEIEKALGLIKEVSKRDPKSKALCQIILDLSKKQDYQKAAELVKLIPIKHYRESALLIIDFYEKPKKT